MHALVLLTLLAQSSAEPVVASPTVDFSDAGQREADAGTLWLDDAGVEAADGGDARPLEEKSAFQGEAVPGLGDGSQTDRPAEDYTPPPLETAQGYDMAGGQGQDRDAPKLVPTAVVDPKAPPKFVKGELSVFLGADRVVTKNNRVGISAGLDRIGDVYYALVEPQVDLRFLADNRLAIGLGVPLRLELFNFGRDATGAIIQTKNLGELRQQDYDQPGDFGRILKYVTFGAKEDNLYVNVGQRYASSIGHGALVRRYAPNLDVDQVRVSAQFDAYNDYAGFELLTNDVINWNLLSGLAFVKPLSFFTDNAMAKSLSVGVSAATDLDAPSALRVDPGNGTRQLDSTGHLLADRRAVTLVGVDAELKVLKTASADIKPYVDYSMLLGGDAGLTIGALGRFNVGTDIVNAFRLVVEARSLGARYAPSYFDTFYEVERYIDREVPSSFESSRAYATKQEDVLSGRLGQRIGYYVEASYGIRRNVGFTVALEGTNNSAEKNLVAHLEVPALDWLQFFGSYYKRGFTDFSQLTTVDNSSVFYAGARLRVLPFLFFNGRAFKTFRVNPEVQRYDNSFGFALDVEIGYEFKREPKTEATVPGPESTPATETKADDKRQRDAPADNPAPAESAPAETESEPPPSGT